SGACDLRERFFSPGGEIGDGTEDYRKNTLQWSRLASFHSASPQYVSRGRVVVGECDLEFIAGRWRCGERKTHGTAVDFGIDAHAARHPQGIADLGIANFDIAEQRTGAKAHQIEAHDRC